MNTETKIVWAADRENFNADTLAELIDSMGGDLEVGSTVYFGNTVPISPRRVCSASAVVDNAADRANDIVGEYADDFASDVTPGALAELDTFLSAWFAKNAPITFYEIENVQEYTITAEDLAD